MVGSVKRAKYQDEFDERVHRVRLAPGRLAALRAGDVLPGRMAIERVAGLVEGHIVRQPTGKSASGTGTTPQDSQWMIGIGQPQ